MDTGYERRNLGKSQTSEPIDSPSDSPDASLAEIKSSPVKYDKRGQNVATASRSCSAILRTGAALQRTTIAAPSVLFSAITLAATTIFWRD